MDKSAYLWPYLTNRKQREKLSEIQQQGSCDDDEEAMVEQITHVDEDDILDDDDIMCEHMWYCDTTQDISQDTNLDQEENSQYIIHDPSSCDLQDTSAQDTSQDIIENSQYIIHDTSSCDLQDTNVDVYDSQDTNQRLSDEEMEDCIRQLIQRGISTVRLNCCHGDVLI